MYFRGVLVFVSKEFVSILEAIHFLMDATSKIPTSLIIVATLSSQLKFYEKFLIYSSIIIVHLLKSLFVRNKSSKIGMLLCLKSVLRGGG